MGEPETPTLATMLRSDKEDDRMEMKTLMEPDSAKFLGEGPNTAELEKEKNRVTEEMENDSVARSDKTKPEPGGTFELTDVKEIQKETNELDECAASNELKEMRGRATKVTLTEPVSGKLLRTTLLIAAEIPP